MPAIVAKHLTVHGEVQGVFFRAATQQHAQDHGVSGWVANRPDGALEAWLEGPEEAVDVVESWIEAGGPADAVVTHVDAADAEPEGHDGFAILG